MMCGAAAAGGPSYTWPLAAQDSYSGFQISTRMSSGSATHPYQFSRLCQQDIVVTDATGEALFTQPSFTHGQVASCVYAKHVLLCAATSDLACWAWRMCTLLLFALEAS